MRIRQPAAALAMVRPVAALIVLALLAPATRADVVINEVFYHAPDDLNNLQFIELYNTGPAAVDLGGWKLAKAVSYQFPAKRTIEPGGFVVLCKDLKEFRNHYGFDAAGEFHGSLSHSSDHIDLINAKGKKIDSVKYKSRPPWPVAADGYSSSLERICPTARVTGPENWAPSPMSSGTPKPAGTPGKKNTNYAAHLPPIITNVKFSVERDSFRSSAVEPGQEVKVDAEVRSAEGLRGVELRYRVAGSGFETEEKIVPMVLAGERNEFRSTFVAAIPPQKAGQIIRFRIKAVDVKDGQRFFPAEHELRPALSVYVRDKLQPGQLPLGLIINVGAAEFRAAQRDVRQFANIGGPSPNPPPRGNSAFVYIDSKTGEAELFDFINVNPRSSGRRVRLHKDHPLGDMTTVVLIFEPMERWVLAEPLAYEVYRKAGNGACRTDFVRTWIDGRPIGYQLLIEVVNKSFLRHNSLRADGNLYKCQWFGAGLVGQHEKKTNVHEGHGDLIDVVDQLNKTSGEAQWAVIQKNFDVKQVATYFAVNTVLSHWDGFFNNYFAYHDVHGTGKWTMYPWDQDKTWGYHDGIRGYEVFYDMPLTFGMAGDRPPGWPKNQPAPDGFGFGSIWWRPGGHFSKPLLANPQFRKLFLARTKEILQTVYTEEVFFPLIDKMGDRIKEDVKIRAELLREDPKRSAEHLRRNLDSLRDHLTKRRRFLLNQDEIKKAM
jgi:hypothetical protein